jgi:FkbM family methyltransferase
MTSRCEALYNLRISKYIENFKSIEHCFTEESIIFDVGSNIGLFSLAICESNKYNKIYLFEPSTEIINYSKTDTLKNYQNIHYINKGASDTNEIMTLYKNKGSSIGWNTCYKYDPIQENGIIPVNNMDKEEVSIITLDSFCETEGITKIDFVKIDVEGLEFKVINGFLNTLSKLKTKPYLYVEVGWGTSHPEWEKANTIYEELFKIGYHRVTFTNKTEDILFIPL